MRLLFDTHKFIWWANSPDKLSKQLLNLCQDIDNDLILSVTSVWEMQIKFQIGKLKFTSSLPSLISSQQQTNSLQILPIELVHVLALQSLSAQHRDPFDRLLIAQATVEQLPILSIDSVFDAYPVQRLW
jgi:PIN domain nuclease of toxin-antitoxin system